MDITEININILSFTLFLPKELYIL